jgi:polygalacturonase
MNCFDIREFGAGEGIATETIQSAIDACHESGGGVVYCPPGELQTGSLWLKSHVTLHLESGCRLRGSDERTDYVENPVPESVVIKNNPKPSI